MADAPMEREFIPYSPVGDYEDEDDELSTDTDDITDDDEEDYDDEHAYKEEEQIEAQKAQEEILHEKLKEIEVQLASASLAKDEQQQRAFLESYDRYLRPQDLSKTERRNMLYRMAYEGPPQEHPWLVKHLVKSYPQLLQELDEVNRNPLLVAVIYERLWYINAVLDSGISKQDLEPLLGPTSEDDRIKRLNSGNINNCIQVAISKDLRVPETKKLIDQASEYTLASQDGSGRTPLHIAVEYERCTPARKDIIMSLIKRGDRAFDQVTEKPDKFSIYRHHLDTREKYDKKKQEQRRSERSEGGQARKAVTQKPRVDDKERSKRNADSTSSRTRSSRDVEALDRERGRRDDRGPTRDDRSSIRPIQRTGSALDRTSAFPNRQTEVYSQQSLEARKYFLQNSADDPFRDFPPEMKRDSGNQESSRRMTVVQQEPKKVAGEPERAPSSTTKKTKASGTSRTSKNVPSKDVANLVAKELKLHYFRTTFRPTERKERKTRAAIQRNHDSAIEFLYGQNAEDKHICFNFPPYRLKDGEKVSFEDFEHSYNGFEFDDVLLYVDFRKLELERPPVRQRNIRPDSDGTGRKDVQPFFNWLYKKGVRNIIKVSVEDREGIPHSDVTIEESLKQFDIEILDWRKCDLCPQAIYDACHKNSKNLGEIHLWWSGNNAILRAWSESDGLVRLPKLKNIHLHDFKAGLDSTARREANIKEFKRRLQREREKLELGRITVTEYKQDPQYDPKGKGRISKQGKGRDPGSLMDTHQWLSVMDNFADGLVRWNPLKDLPADLTKISNLPEDLLKDVTVALIDDGVSFMHRALADKLAKGKSFDSGYGDQDVLGAPEPFYGSTTGHGTCMAYMIQRVCPNVKIYVCKLDTIRKEPGVPANFTAKSAADAVEFAVDRGFDIISMSWTIQRSDDEEKAAESNAHLKRLQSALERAQKNNTMLFCSAPDVGASSRQSMTSFYPFGRPIPHMFKIGAAKADGSMYGWAGNSDQVDFILPGHNVMLREGDKISEEDDIPKTGSSVATALAAGLAALIIQCVRLGALHNHVKSQGAVTTTAPNVESLRAIKQFDAMKEAFKKVSTGYTESDKRLEVEKVFKQPGTELNSLNNDNTDDERRWNLIVQLARDLVSWNTQIAIRQA
ncbi:hypothetical protein BU24DRAFT_465179 [Aaosphaeria arxii CBS 175.79]|uniref:Peptidase S8/S53 domain-containing protein n=1 Tax=Aaosphaeria arxii CBS 175.79 TaxID=1450172 RepID=A0A6A5XIP1_9PLEO|nr:uncharacterized protein BU24DRAFT_465179 [Aaosphaeria arxii CBS 175.79]KAF2012823.1 hypothetical protein BU24DRAFT_465179 [Aaosphaeria arxii CBS 175.79]